MKLKTILFMGIAFVNTILGENMVNLTNTTPAILKIRIGLEWSGRELPRKDKNLVLIPPRTMATFNMKADTLHWIKIKDNVTDEWIRLNDSWNAYTSPYDFDAEIRLDKENGYYLYDTTKNKQEKPTFGSLNDDEIRRYKNLPDFDPSLAPSNKAGS